MIELMRQLRSLLAALDPAALAGDECVRLVSELAATENACASARVRAAAQAAATGAHRQSGFRDAHEWMARQAGCSTAKARAALNTEGVLGDHPSTAGALSAGEISFDQAQQIVAGAAGDADSELELLEQARSGGLQALAQESRRRQLARIDPRELAERQRKAREFHHWTDALGMTRFRGALPPLAGVPFTNRLDEETDRIRRAARADGGELEEREAYAADALVAMLSGEAAAAGARRADLVVVVDSRKFDIGDEADGPCHIIGGGPIPMAEVRRLATDAFLKVVLHDGVRIDLVAHVGRYKPAELRTALEVGPPPTFEGVTCCEPGCGRQYHLEWDHIDPVANNGRTSFANLAARCWPHHRAKTERERAQGLLGGGRAPP